MNKKYTPLTPTEQAEVLFGLCAAVVDSVLVAFPADMQHKRVYRQVKDLNQRIVGILDGLESTGRVEQLNKAGDIADGFNKVLTDLGLVVEDTQS